MCVIKPEKLHLYDWATYPGDNIMANPINLNKQNVAIEGYDPVSYFTGHPVVGNPQITSTYREATY
jgi:hypothetical protein